MEKSSYPALCLFAVGLLLQGHQTWQLEEDFSSGLTRTHRGERDWHGFCPSGWYTYGEMCYFVETSTRTWEKAVRACLNMDSVLVSIQSQDEQDFLNLLMLEIRSEAWIGLSRSTYNYDVFEWTDSSSLNYTNWAEGEPNNYEKREKCVEMHYERSSVGDWNDASCSKRASYICKRMKDPTLTQPGRNPSMCPGRKDWLKMRDSCYRIFHRAESASSWPQAQSLCKGYGGNLAYVKNPGVNKLLQINTKEMQGPFWTGIKMTPEHRYTWLGKNHHLMYSNWQTDEPKEIPDGQNCVAIDAEGKWVIRDCWESHSFICEIGPELPEAPTLQPFGDNMTCPDTSQKWVDIGGRYCYIIEMVAKSKWREALCHCRGEGGDLVSLHSSEETAVILHYIKHHDVPMRSIYIGLVRDQNGNFGWSDGSAYDYTKWFYGEPNSYNEQCVQMQMTDGKWNDVFCQNVLSFVCSTPKVPQTANSTSQREKLMRKRETAELKSEGTQLSAGNVVLVTITCLLAVAAVLAVMTYFFGDSLKTKLLQRSSYSGI